MKTILFISEDYIANNSEIQDTTEIKKVFRNIKFAQRVYIQRILGTALYKDLQDEVEAYTQSGTSMTAEYETLLEEYIQPIVMNYAIYKAIPHLNYSITNKAIVKKEADNTIASDLDEIRYLQNQYKDTADLYAEQCIKFLIQGYNDNKFSLYSCTENDDLDEMNPDRTNDSIYGTMYLGDEI